VQSTAIYGLFIFAMLRKQTFINHLKFSQMIYDAFNQIQRDPEAPEGGSESTNPDEVVDESTTQQEELNTINTDGDNSGNEDLSSLPSISEVIAMVGEPFQFTPQMGKGNLKPTTVGKWGLPITLRNGKKLMAFSKTQDQNSLLKYNGETHVVFKQTASGKTFVEGFTQEIVTNADKHRDNLDIELQTTSLKLKLIAELGIKDFKI
jgi:hypothetical protein